MRFFLAFLKNRDLEKWGKSGKISKKLDIIYFYLNIFVLNSYLLSLYTFFVMIFEFSIENRFDMDPFKNFVGVFL
jgi:hypothetical protein